MWKMEFTSLVAQFDSNLRGFHVIVPLDVSAFYVKRGIKRFNCSINSFETFPCALISSGAGRYFIMLNKERVKKWQLRIGQSVVVELSEDQSKYGMPMPVEMAELMKIDDEGCHLFHTLTPGKQRSLLYLIGKPKKSETRLQKAWIVLEYLKSTRGKIEYQSLNEAFRANRDIGF